MSYNSNQYGSSGRRGAAEDGAFDEYQYQRGSMRRWEDAHEDGSRDEGYVSGYNSSHPSEAVTSSSAPAEQRAGRLVAWGVPVVVVLCISFITVATLNFSRPFSSGFQNDKPKYSSLSLAHSALNLQPDELGRYEYSGLSDEGKQVLFDAFAATYNKQYNDDSTKEVRFKAFRDVLQKVHERNENERKMGGTAVHGITKFADFSEDEFTSTFLRSSPTFRGKSSGKARRLGDKSSTKKASADEEDEDEDASDSKSSKSSKSASSKKSSSSSSSKSSKNSKSSNLPDSVDWEGIYTTKVKDQGYCGACWAFAVAQQLESDGVRLGLYDLDVQLSPQQIISCDTEAVGCSGGWTESAYNYVAEAGLSYESQYPFSAYMEKEMTEDSAKCLPNSIKGVISVAGYYSLVSEDDMVEYVKSTGPLSICVDSTEWNTYVKGIVKSCPQNANHCVQAVGVTTSNDGTGYWKVRNSWGTEWGEDGYIRLAVGQDTCAITYDPTFTEPFLV